MGMGTHRKHNHEHTTSSLISRSGAINITVASLTGSCVEREYDTPNVHPKSSI